MCIINKKIFIKYQRYRHKDKHTVDKYIKGVNSRENLITQCIHQVNR